MREHSGYLTLTFSITLHWPEIQVNLCFINLYFYLYRCLNVYLCTKFVQCVEPESLLDPVGLELDIVMSHHVGSGSRTRSSGRPTGDLNCWVTSPAHVYLIMKAVKDLQLCFIMTKDYSRLSVTLVGFPRGSFRQEPETYIACFRCQIFTFFMEECCE